LGGDRASWHRSRKAAVPQGLVRGRIDLTTEDWNEAALRFYDSLGADRHGQKIFLRLSGEALEAIATKP
jgi:hypothetical protein